MVATIASLNEMMMILLVATSMMMMMTTPTKQLLSFQTGLLLHTKLIPKKKWK